VNAKPDLGAVSRREANSNQDLNFEKVNIKFRRMKAMSNTFEKKMMSFQQSQPIPVFVNKYAILYNLQKNRRHFSTILGPVKWHYLGIKNVLLTQGKGKWSS
jgi:hypothetical protein